MNGTVLGKISKISFGQWDERLGVRITLSGKPGWMVDDFKGDWSGKRPDYAKWSEEDRIKHLGEMVMWLDTILTKANKRYIDELVGVPVEATFEGNLLKEWRVLEEVI